MLSYDQQSIQRIRKSLNLSMDGFARGIGNGATRQLVSQWERGLQTPSVASLLKIVNHFEIPITAFFKERRGGNAVDS
ncbi:MAG: helix-turn-helix transcriptional regulator, partial [Spirochaetaceae bacterium]|nr:helix-turn-helix transcriptional regulator [Spirochaetaceae bacterium]